MAQSIVLVVVIDSERSSKYWIDFRGFVCNFSDAEKAENLAGGEGIETPTPPGRCVLVIDDDPTQRDLIRRFLTKEGFTLRTANGGAAGLRLARELKPVAITLDVMPRMDGWSVLAALRGDIEFRDIPVIMLTMVDDPDGGFAMGASDFATKPVDRARLSQILKKYTCPHPPCPVLLVEDDMITREVTRSILEREGWSVTEAENGRLGFAFRFPSHHRICVIPRRVYPLQLRPFRRVI